MVEYPPAIRNKSHSKSSFPKIYSNIFNFQSPYRDKDKIQIPFWLPNHKIDINNFRPEVESPNKDMYDNRAIYEIRILDGDLFYIISD